MRMKGHWRGPGASRNLKVKAKLHMVSTDMIQIEKRNFMSLRRVLFLIQLEFLEHQ